MRNEKLKLHLGKLQKRDIKKAIQFAITGMHFDWYTDSKTAQQLYGRYFFYMELLRATRIIAAYTEEGVFAGILLADIKCEAKQHRSFWKWVYVRFFELLQTLTVKDGTDVYGKVNRKMLAEYVEKNNVDGELTFLAVDPEIGGRGVGSFLLEELSRREQGKRIYLYTDDACNYRFYEYKGFAREGNERIVLKIGNKETALRCFLYARQM